VRGSMMVSLAAAVTLLLAGCGGDEQSTVEGVSLPSSSDAGPDDVSATDVPDSVKATGRPRPTSTPTTESPLPEVKAGDCTESFKGGIADNDVVVPAGETCELSDVRISGNIIVNEGATLRASEIFVDGDIQADGHRVVSVDNSTVTGNIQLEGGFAATIDKVQVDGDLQSDDNTGLQVFQDNRIGGNLQCEGNDPAPTGVGNQVEGDKEGQCSSL
jgi:hypothetical protein